MSCILYPEALVRGDKDRNKYVHLPIAMSVIHSFTDADHLYGFSTVKDMEGEADSLLPLSTSGGQAVAVFSFDGEVCIIREWGQLEVLCTEGLGWRHTGMYMT